MIVSTAIGSHIKTYINSEVRAGRMNPTYAGYMAHVKGYWEDKVIAKVKTDKSKETKKAALKQLLDELSQIKKPIENSFVYVKAVNEAKLLIIKKLTSLLDSRVFVLKKNGEFVPTAPEGYVAIGKDNQAVKLVDRLAFSHFNFSDDYVKGWQR